MDAIERKTWPWCIESGSPINAGHPALRPEPLEKGRYRCWSCGRDVAARNGATGEGLKLARHKRPNN